jgi:hypothetical protein
MKYLTLILALVISATSYSQDETLYVNNTTSCTYQYTVSVYLEGTNCAVNQYQLKTPLTLTPSGAILDQGFAIYGVDNTEWYDYSTTPPSVVLDTDIPAGDLRFTAFKMTSGESISIGDCGTNSSDQDSCGMDGFTAEFSIFTPIPNAKIVNITLD